MLCLKKWHNGKIALTKGTYVSNGFVATMFIKSSPSPNGNYDELAFGGPLNFRGYYPGYSVDATAAKNAWTCALLKAHPHNTAGTVKLASADPRDPPKISFNYVLVTMQPILRQSLSRSGSRAGHSETRPTEILPGPSVKSTEQIQEYISENSPRAIRAL
ncbi:hypothetical protein GMDG_01510 [Pseudogymnoascus destructans 20631-21]|uniref:Glucose-methanol-choline oxidoreductase C-terminal domain-containing protein n=1 Tax=Pseudogymnoascus destructans (strain ATCC MYA-4855 / 20631-21) TaxID=658429 RepID=L8FV67_PSED2|nr:hypothetical protein GMDG_01510 [Pseudogymnoascus destructans 20631-21]